MRGTRPWCFPAVLAFGALAAACEPSSISSPDRIDDRSPPTGFADSAVSTERTDGGTGPVETPDAEGRREEAGGDRPAQLPTEKDSALEEGAAPAAHEEAGPIPDTTALGGDDSAPTDAGLRADAEAYILSPDGEVDLGDADAGDSDAGATKGPGDSGYEDGGDGGIPECKPIECGTHAWACWPMPNSVASGLPNAASFTDLGDGTVRDNRTCLVWEKRITSESRSYTYLEAQERCTNPSYQGTGWRLPSRIELMSIADYSRISPSTDIDAFTPLVPYDNFWSLSSIPGTTKAWTVRFYEGLLQSRNQSSSYYARCVRGNGDPGLTNKVPTNHYSSPAYGEVLDNYTRLVWQEKDSQPKQTMSFQTALGYCANLSLNGKKWRLPSIKELATLVNEFAPASESAPVVEMSVFGTMAAANYWSSSLYNNQQPTSSTYPWTLKFADGSISSSESSAYAKCVQDVR